MGALVRKGAGSTVPLWPDVGDPAQVRYLAAWEPPDELHVSFRTSSTCSRRAQASISSIFWRYPPRCPSCS